ncbi:hypothetical protein F5Y09DRAFT_344937 [Xylaria sp. FL1042]|nr:hypothetical protein F5Y09DRAFT_344937 [Xylaria sp. FL1042]
MRSDSMGKFEMNVNDILISIKKELANSQAGTLVPLLFLGLNSSQTAVDEAARIVSRSITRLETAESEILDRYSSSPETQDVI